MMKCRCREKRAAIVSESARQPFVQRHIYGSWVPETASRNQNNGEAAAYNISLCNVGVEMVGSANAYQAHAAL